MMDMSIQNRCGLLLACILSLLFIANGCVTMVDPPPQIPLSTTSTSSVTEEIQIIAKNLQIPWDVAFLPKGDLLVTERVGNILRIKSDGTKEKIEGLPDVKKIGEGGLLGLVLHPDFQKNGWLYVYLTYGSLGSTKCQVERYRLDGNVLADQKMIIDGIPGAIYHDGGRLAFGPDGMLYITTGDATNGENAQNKNSLAGKILRVKDDGLIPADNPFGTAVWSYGHRNPQGITWDQDGRLWETEHGRSGVLSGYDELNLIVKGRNYGWPKIQGDGRATDMESPKQHSGADDTWAPASAAFWNGKIYFGGLRGESLYEADITTPRPLIKEYFHGVFGRIRTVQVGPDGFFYLTTSNTDGRGNPLPDDDRLIRVDPKKLK